MMDCACSMGFGSMTWMMLLPALFVAALLIGGIVLVRRLWPGSASSADAAPPRDNANASCREPSVHLVD